MLREENNDFREKNNQLHEILKMKINDLKEAEECIQYLKEKSKQVFQNEHHNDHSYTSCSQGLDGQLDKMLLKPTIGIQQIRFRQTIIVAIDKLIN